MNKLFNRTILGLLLLVALVGIDSSQAQTIQSTTLVQTGPAVCPPDGCAAGQTLDFRLTFDAATFDASLTPNVQVCVFTPTGWGAEGWRNSPNGLVTSVPYTLDTTFCGTAPNGYLILGGVSAQLPVDAFGDMLSLGFRINRSAVTSGSALVRVFQQSSSGWAQSDQSFAPVPVVPTAAEVYVANDAAACGSFSPCYLNATANLSTGIGTGLKDAVDAQAATINILGSYQVKSNTVLIDREVTIQGQNDSRITYSGTACTEPLLRITAGAAFRNLTLTDGTCSVTNRDLLAIESDQDVTLEYLDLIGGLDAIKAADTTGSVVVRFSQILNNSGYALFRVPSTTGTGTVQLTGNNIAGNKAGPQVDCALMGTADHNFWGSGVNSTAATTQCNANDTRQLGAAVLARSDAAGVDGHLLTVATTRQTAFGNLLAVQRSPEGSDFQLNVVNHGAGAPENVPFTGGAPDSLTPCSNYYDVFLEKDSAVGGSLNLSLRYDRTAGCTSTIESIDYCSATDSAKFPLWWYSPSVSAPSGWNTTGSTGQTTTCDLTNNEVTVAIDSSGRPNFTNDLNFAPFVVGLSSQPSSVVISRLEAVPGSGQVAVQWTTTSEVNTSGFYVLRSTSDTSGFTRVSSFIPRKGSGVTGANYEYVDTGLTNGTTLYYRLEIISTSQESSFSQVVSTLVGAPTNTATVTATQTPTGSATITPTGPTPTGSLTLTRTPTRTITMTRVPTRTRTPVRYATYYIYRSPTTGPTRTLFPTRTQTVTFTLSGIRVTETAMALASPQSPFPNVTVTVTPSPSPSVTAGGGYPVPPGTVTNEATQDNLATASITPTITPPSQSGSMGDGKTGTLLTSFGLRYWPWILGLLGFELAAVIGVGYFLYRKNELILPFLDRKNNPLVEDLPVEEPFPPEE